MMPIFGEEGYKLVGHWNNKIGQKSSNEIMVSKDLENVVSGHLIILNFVTLALT